MQFQQRRPSSVVVILALILCLAAVFCAVAATNDSVSRIERWEFLVIKASAEEVREAGALGISNSAKGRGFYVSNPLEVVPGRAYEFSVSCKTIAAPLGAAFARIFWYQGPDRGLASAVRKYDDTKSLGGDADWTRLAAETAIVAPDDAKVAVIRLESRQPKGRSAPEIALAGAKGVPKNWELLLQANNLAYTNCGPWLAPRDFGKYKLVVLCDAPRALTDQENKTIRDYVRGGGHVILSAATPCQLAGDKNLSALDWLGASRYAYGAFFKHCVVLDDRDSLTGHLAKDDELMALPGRLSCLGGLKSAKSLIGTPAYSLVSVNDVGQGRAAFFGSEPPRDPDLNPAWTEVFLAAILESGVMPGASKPFRVWFKDVVFAPAQ